jgi:hypothetical protein
VDSGLMNRLQSKQILLIFKKIDWQTKEGTSRGRALFQSMNLFEMPD